MAFKLAPPPRPPILQDQQTQRYFQDVHLWLDDLYRKMGAASDTLALNISGTAATITQPLPASQLSGAVPIANGGTGATDAVSAATALGVQSAFSPGTSGDVPISDGVTYTTRHLGYADIEGVPQIEHEFGVALTAPATAVLGDFGDTVVTWATSFSDSAYSLSAVCHPTTGVPIVTIQTKNSNNCTIRVTNATAVQVTGTLDVQGIHS